MQPQNASSMRVLATYPTHSVLARSLFTSAPNAAPSAAPLSSARRERRAQYERRQLLLAVPPHDERRLFDRRVADRARSGSGDTAFAVCKGLLIDIYA